MQVANLQLLPFDKAKAELEKALVSDDDVERWWASYNFV